MHKFSERKKVNFMVNKELLYKIQAIIPAGERSDFVNQALDDAIVKYGRIKASRAMDEFAKSHKISMSTEEFIKLKNYGRP